MSPAPSPAVVVLAAGLATRYGDLKQLDPVGPDAAAILDYTLADAARAGFVGAVVVVRPGIAERVRRHLERRGTGGLAVGLAHQTTAAPIPAGCRAPAGRDRPWGTAQAVLAAAPELDGPFAVANADDHYGAAAWSCLADWTAASGTEDVAIVGYRLDATLSEHGGVSRGVCEADDGGRLVRIAEATDVRRDPDGLVRGRVGGEVRVLDAAARISMNLWGFRPPVLAVLEDAFRSFLDADPDAGAELQLPEAVGAAVASGRLRARLLACGDDWFGMTWPDDRRQVARRLARRGPPAAAAGSARTGASPGSDPSPGPDDAPGPDASPGSDDAPTRDAPR